MYLRVISRDAWTVLAVCADEERCQLLESTEQSGRDDRREYARLLRAIARLATHGPPLNAQRSRALSHGIYELKTPGGMHVLYFFDEGRVLICTEAMAKPKSHGLNVAVERAARAKWRYLNDKRRGALRILEDE